MEGVRVRVYIRKDLSVSESPEGALASVDAEFDPDTGSISAGGTSYIADRDLIAKLHGGESG